MALFALPATLRARPAISRQLTAQPVRWANISMQIILVASATSLVNLQTTATPRARPAMLRAESAVCPLTPPSAQSATRLPTYIYGSPTTLVHHVTLQAIRNQGVHV